MNPPRAAGAGLWVLAALGLAAGLGGVVAGCGGSPTVSLAQGPRGYTAQDYDTVLEKWSRSEHLVVFQGLEDRIKVDATYLSWDFRWAFVARYAYDATLSESERQRVLAAALATAQNENEFFVALATQNTRWGELNRNTTAWHVRLIDDRGREVEPTRIERVRRVGAADRTYFPYLTPWRTAFRLHFPKRAVVGDEEYEVLGPGTRYFILRFAGALGTADLRWNVDPAAASVPTPAAGGGGVVATPWSAADAGDAGDAGAAGAAGAVVDAGEAGVGASSGTGQGAGVDSGAGAGMGTGAGASPAMDAGRD